ncbi:superantigen-like protein SSL4 [Fusibacter ferrireducens]|uniref:DUF3298 domain-containing protein n=1 Tax=Fusibacter ferrireducens TaxID=2785058 RepID=A0ABR9ZMH1_9FIRM|nr:hypothetical protein [Fusibacter ferrireducens]MBF4691652.1 hypothetical protein [Fusibacter ferrireducens]
MKYYLRSILAVGMITTFIFTTGCQKDESKPIQTPVEVEVSQPEKPQEEESKTTSPPVETQPEESEITPPKTELANDYQYELTTSSSTEEGIYTIEYPVMKGLAGELTQDYINQSLKNAAMSMLLPDVSVENPLVVTYEIKRQDKKYLSVLYKGLLTWENGAIEIWNPITIDMHSSNLILNENLVKDDLKSKTEFNHIFSEAALQMGFEFESPEDWMGMYFTDDEIVFYFMENDFATNYTLIQIPFSRVMDYINIDFDTHPTN